MADFTVNSKEIVAFEKTLGKNVIKFQKKKHKTLTKIAVLVQGLARAYCPESLTTAMRAKNNKSGKSKHIQTTGSLRDSITHEIGEDFASIFVPSNSRGGAYAKKIHDEKGSTWEEVSERTKQKGPKADDKYIERAAEDSEKDIERLVDKLVDGLF